jgi:hypothetical protein
VIFVSSSRLIKGSSFFFIGLMILLEEKAVNRFPSFEMVFIDDKCERIHRFHRNCYHCCMLLERRPIMKPTSEVLQQFSCY